MISRLTGWIAAACCVVLLIFSAFAASGNDDFYLQLLLYGTDRDIAEGFARVDEDTELGDRTQRLLLEALTEPHDLNVYLSLVRYIGSTRMEKANRSLIYELERKAAGDDYLEAVIHALAALKKSESVQPLRELYERPSTTSRIKRAVVTAWGEIGDRRIEEFLISIVQDLKEPVDVRAAAVLSLGKVNSRQSLDLLEEIAVNSYERTSLRMYAVYSLGMVGGESVLDVLAGLIHDPVHQVAEYAVVSISEIDSPKKGDLLIEALRSDFDKVRFYGARELGEMKYRPALEILTFKSQYDRSQAVQREARKAIAAINSDSETADGERERAARENRAREATEQEGM
jgi:hypothetical protein